MSPVDSAEKRGWATRTACVGRQCRQTSRCVCQDGHASDKSATAKRRDSAVDGQADKDAMDVAAAPQYGSEMRKMRSKRSRAVRQDGYSRAPRDRTCRRM